MVSRPISWGHWGETGTVHCGERCSSPAGGTPATLGHKHQSFLAEDLFACRMVRRSALGLEALDREPFLPSWPRHGGAWAASLSFWDSLYEVLACGRGCCRPAAPWARERWGWNRWKLSEILLLLFEQVSLVPLQHRLGVQTQTSLTRCCVPLAHQHWRCEQRLGGQGRSLQRQCSVGGQIARERLFHTRHRSLTMLTRPHHITVVIGRGDEKASWKGSRRMAGWCRGGVLNHRKRSSSLPLCSSTWYSAGQSTFYLATAQVTTSTSSSYWGEREGETSSTLPTSTSSEEDRRSAEPAARGEVEGKYPHGGLPISGSGQRIWWVRMEIETRSSRSLHQIQLRTPWAPPLLRLSGNGVSATGSAGERPLRKEVTCLQSLSLCDPALNKKADNLLFDLLPWAPCLNYFTPPPQKN